MTKEYITEVRVKVLSTQIAKHTRVLQYYLVQLNEIIYIHTI